MKVQGRGTSQEGQKKVKSEESRVKSEKRKREVIKEQGRRTSRESRGKNGSEKTLRSEVKKEGTVKESEKDKLSFRTLDHCHSALDAESLDSCFRRNDIHARESRGQNDMGVAKISTRPNRVLQISTRM